MFENNKYDRLMSKQKSIRNKIYNINTKANSLTEKLQTKIALIRYRRDTKCKTLGNELQDAISLTENEVKRIANDNKELFERENKDE